MKYHGDFVFITREFLKITVNYPWHFNTMQYNGNHRVKISPFILKITREMCFQLSRCKKRCKIAFLHGEIWKIHREIFFRFFL